VAGTKGWHLRECRPTTDFWQRNAPRGTIKGEGRGRGERIVSSPSPGCAGVALARRDRQIARRGLAGPGLAGDALEKKCAMTRCDVRKLNCACNDEGNSNVCA